MAYKVGRQENETTDWRQKKQMPECLSYLSEHKMWHDVTFTFSGKLLHGHRLILSLRSPVFQAMFYGPAADKNEVIEIPDIEHDIFDCILRYMYTDKCKLTGDKVLPILYGAKKYCLPELVDRCALFLKESMSYDNVCTIYDHAKMYNMKDVVTASFDFMVVNSSHVCQSVSSVCLSHSSMLEFLSSERLTGDELEHFKFANKWANQNCLSSGMKPIPENKRKVLGDIVKKISYQLIKAEDFARIVVPTKILLAEEENQIFQYIVTRDKSCIENFSLPPRPGFPVTIDTETLGCTPRNDTSFCFQFSCNTNVRLVKLLLLQCVKKEEPASAASAIKQYFAKRPIDNLRNVPGKEFASSRKDKYEGINKDIGITFQADTEYTLDLRTKSCSKTSSMKCGTDGQEDRIVVAPFSGKSFGQNCGHSYDPSYGQNYGYCQSCGHSYDPRYGQSYGESYGQGNGKRSGPHTKYVFTSGTFSCTIKKIPASVKTVEFRILP